jgi:hypothetical protein
MFKKLITIKMDFVTSFIIRIKLSKEITGYFERQGENNFV